MIVVKVEKWPFGNAEQAEVLGVVCIANKGPAENKPEVLPDEKDFNADLYDYMVEFAEPVHMRAKRRTIQHFRRKGWLPLVTQAFDVLRMQTERELRRG